jgi:propanol-preferring alcohol dehydrogenase
VKAWILETVNGKLREADIPVPVPGDDQVLVRVKAVGLCHSDVGYMEGTIPLNMPLPVILGHEATGIIEAVGSKVTGWQVGDAVVGAISLNDAPGVSRDGAFAEYIVITASRLVRVPDGLDWLQAAVATDAGNTSYHGVVVAGGVEAGDRVGIIGLGGLGMVGAQIAAARGATVYGAEPRQALWDQGREKGLVRVFADVTDFQGLDLDVIIDFAGFGSTTAGAIRAIKAGGRVVLVGVGVMEWTLNSVDLVSRSITLQGATIDGNPEDLREVLEMFAGGAVTIRAEAIGFADIAEGLRRLQRGEVDGRLVALLD